MRCLDLLMNELYSITKNTFLNREQIWESIFFVVFMLWHLPLIEKKLPARCSISDISALYK